MSAIPQKIELRPMPTANQDETVEQAQNGSSVAFEQLIRLNQGLVRSFLARYSDCPQTADDLAQEVFVVAYQRLADFKRSSKFSTWLLGIARNKALHHLRAEMRRRKHQQKFFDFEIARRQFLRLNAEDVDSFDDLRIDLKSCLDRLPEASSRLVDAYYFQQQSAQEIAELRQQKSGAIRMKLLRIRAVLQKCMSEKSNMQSGKSGS